MLAYTDSDDVTWSKMVTIQALRELSFHSTECYQTFGRIFNVSVDQNLLIKEILQSDDYTLPILGMYDNNQDVPCFIDETGEHQAVSGLTKLADLML